MNGARIPPPDAKPGRFSYCNCIECGLLVRMSLIDSPAGLKAECYAAECPNCKCVASLTFMAPKDRPTVVIPSLSVVKP